MEYIYDNIHKSLREMVIFFYQYLSLVVFLSNLHSFDKNAKVDEVA